MVGLKQSNKGGANNSFYYDTIHFSADLDGPYDPAIENYNQDFVLVHDSYYWEFAIVTPNDSRVDLKGSKIFINLENGEQLILTVSSSLHSLYPDGINPIKKVYYVTSPYMSSQDVAALLENAKDYKFLFFREDTEPLVGATIIHSFSNIDLNRGTLSEIDNVKLREWLNLRIPDNTQRDEREYVEIQYKEGWIGRRADETG